MKNDNAVIELLLAMVPVAAKAGPFTDIGALEIGAGGQDDIGEFCLALEPDRLVDDEFQIRRCYIRTQRLVLFIVERIEPPYL